MACSIAACASPDEVSYAISTQSRMVCCRTMNFSVAEFPGASKNSSGVPGVSVMFPANRITGNCESGAESQVVIANNSGDAILIPTSRELEGSRIKLYPWRLHHDSAQGNIRLARQIQYGDMFERPDGRLHFLRLADGYEVRLNAWVPGQWLCTKPTELYEGYLAAELDPAFYAQRARGLRTSPYEQAKDLVSPIGMRYDVIWVTLDFLKVLPVISRTTNSAGDTISVLLDVKEEPAAHLNAAQRVASSNIIEMVINK
ncbi:MAG: hypothetical protein H7X80_02155 [bacterium]|nr:hypothetical protein [Candidatus Kapabacteria bacterium]